MSGAAGPGVCEGPQPKGASLPRELERGGDGDPRSGWRGPPGPCAVRGRPNAGRRGVCVGAESERRCRERWLGEPPKAHAHAAGPRLHRPWQQKNRESVG